MEKKIFTTWTLLLQILCLSAVTMHVRAEEAETASSNKTKSVSKTFELKGNERLYVESSFGNTTVIHRNMSSATIQVNIESKSRNEKRAQNNLDRVEVNIAERGNTISAITKMNNNKGNNDGESVSITVIITIPPSMDIEMKQSFGNIQLSDTHTGRAKFEVSFGNLNAADFTQPLEVSSKFGNVRVGNVPALSLNLQHSGDNEVKDCDDLSVDMQFSGLKVGRTKTLKFKNQHGNLSVKQSDDISGSLSFGGLNIDKLNNTLIVNKASHSSIDIKEVSSNFKKIDAGADFGNLNIGIPSGASFKVNAKKMRFGNVDLGGFTPAVSNVDKDRENHYYEINGGRSEIQFNGNGHSSIRIRKL